MKTINIIGLIIIIGILTYIAFFKKPKVVEVPSSPIYTTDTIHVPEPYEVPKPYPVSVPPKLIYVYAHSDSVKLDSLSWVISENEAVIKYYRESLKYNERFLITYPMNPKLVDMDICRDSLSLSLLNPDGDFYSYTYPLDMMNYKYRWTLGEKLTKKSHTYYQKKDQSISLYGNVGYDFVGLTPYIGLYAEKPYGKFMVYSTADIGLLNIKGSSLKIGVGYKIKN